MAGLFLAYINRLKKMQGKASESEEIYKKWTESWKLSDIDIQASHL